jgi:hypothetical protein
VLAVHLCDCLNARDPALVPMFRKIFFVADQVIIQEN